MEHKNLLILFKYKWRYILHGQLEIFKPPEGNIFLKNYWRLTSSVGVGRVAGGASENRNL